MQVYEDIDMLTSNRSTSVVAIYGGKAYEGQIDQLKAGAQIVVGTPGRLIDLEQTSACSTCRTRPRSCSTRPTRCSTSASSPDIEKIFPKVPRGPPHAAVLGDDARPDRRARAPLHDEPDPHPRDRPRRGSHAGQHQAPRLPRALARQGRGHRPHPAGRRPRQDRDLHAHQARRAAARRRARRPRLQRRRPCTAT